MSELYIRNWDKWQSYRSDRDQPPWIKIHRRLMRKPKWIALSDAQRGQLVAIWLLAADRNGSIPSDPELVKKLCYMNETPDLNYFLEKRFLDVKATPIRRRPDVKVTRQTRLDKKRGEERSGAKAPPAFEGKIIRLNQADFDLWKASFPFLDLRAYLVSRDEYLASLPDDDNRRRQWMVSTSADLRNKSEAARAKRKPPTVGLQFKDKAPDPAKPSREERERQLAKIGRAAH